MPHEQALTPALRGLRRATLAVAALGLVWSLAIPIVARVRPDLEAALLFLPLFGVFALGVLGGLVLQSELTKNLTGAQRRRVTWAATPPWLRRLTLGLMAVAIVVLVVSRYIEGPPKDPHNTFTPLSIAAFGVLASTAVFGNAYVANRLVLSLCPNGHVVAPGERFCDACGATVVDTVATPPPTGSLYVTMPTWTMALLAIPALLGACGLLIVILACVTGHTEFVSRYGIFLGTSVALCAFPARRLLIGVRAVEFGPGSIRFSRLVGPVDAPSGTILRVDPTTLHRDAVRVTTRTGKLLMPSSAGEFPTILEGIRARNPDARIGRV